MYIMKLWWLPICICICATKAIEFSCNDPQCEMTVSNIHGERTFVVEGHKIEYMYMDERNKRSFEGFSVSCGGWSALDSPAMPRFRDMIHVWTIDISDCPPPTNKSLTAALAAINVYLQPKTDDSVLELEMSNVPLELLTPQYFAGFESLTSLTIQNNNPVNGEATPVAGFLLGLPKLRKLQLTRVPLAAGELSRFPRKIKRLWLSTESLSSLPSTIPEVISEIVCALPALNHLLLDGLGLSATDTNTTTVRTNLNIPSTLKSLQLLYWMERRIAPLQYCKVLRSLEIRNPKVEELPERWVAACPQLVKLVVEHADRLKSLPAKLLDDATALKRLVIRYTSLQTLPDGFLDSTPNLLKLDLSGNRLRNIPSHAFVAPTGLQYLNLENNKLRTSDVYSLAPLTSLRTLNIGRNQYYNLCEENEYSPLQNLTNLRTLTLSESTITRICRDWRENLILLQNLDLSSTDIFELKFTDLQYTRDSSVTNPKVKLSSSVTSIELTKEDYEASLSLEEPGITLIFDIDKRVNMISDVTCNCRSYWFRRVLDIKNRPVRVGGLYCNNQRYFLDMSAEEMCTESF